MADDVTVGAIPDWTAIAAGAYRACAKSMSYQTFNGRPMPKWEELPRSRQLQWEAAARRDWDRAQRW